MTTTDEDFYAARSGIAALERSVAKAKTSTTGYGLRSNNIYWKDDKETKILRILTDPLVIKIHEFIPVNIPGQTRMFVCAMALRDARPCYICDNVQVTAFGKTGPAKAKESTLALVALREELTEGVVTDVLHKEQVNVKIGDELILTSGVPELGIVSQGTKNFWSFFLGYHKREKSFSSRDYEVTRNGKGKDTTYSVAALDHDPELKTTDQLQEHYAIALASHPSLIEFIEQMGSQDRYDHFLGTKAESVAAESTEQGEAPVEPTESVPAASQSDLRDRLLKYSKAK